MLVGGLFFNLFYQVHHLSILTQDKEELSFEDIPVIESWHNREAKFVYLTFDDGPSNNADKILDILDQYNVKGTFFVLGSAIEGYSKSNQVLKRMADTGDGPSNNADKILDILDQYNVKGTFFVLGSAIEGYSKSNQVLKRMADTGHYIGMHSMSHNYSYLYDKEKGGENFVGELLEEQALIKKVTGGFVSQLCRAPYGSGGTFNAGHIEALKEAGIKCWDWDVDSLDWEAGATVEGVMENIEYCMKLWNYPKNTIVLFHEKDITVEVLPKVIEYYMELGYEFLPYNPDYHIVKNLVGSDEI